MPENANLRFSNITLFTVCYFLNAKIDLCKAMNRLKYLNSGHPNTGQNACPVFEWSTSLDNFIYMLSLRSLIFSKCRFSTDRIKQRSRV